jgi:hypothetical protein
VQRDGRERHAPVGHTPDAAPPCRRSEHRRGGEAVVALPDHLRRALVLRYVADLRDADVARCLRLTRRFYAPVMRLALRRVDARMEAEEPGTGPGPESTTGAAALPRARRAARDRDRLSRPIWKHGDGESCTAGVRKPVVLRY